MPRAVLAPEDSFLDFLERSDGTLDPPPPIASASLVCSSGFLDDAHADGLDARRLTPMDLGQCRRVLFMSCEPLERGLAQVCLLVSCERRGVVNLRVESESASESAIAAETPLTCSKAACVCSSLCEIASTSTVVGPEEEQRSHIDAIIIYACARNRAGFVAGSKYLTAWLGI